MATSAENRGFARTGHPLATEFGVIVVVTIALYFLQNVALDVASRVLDVVGFSGGLLASGLFLGGAMVAGSAALTAAYAKRREVEVGLGLPTAEDVPSVALAATLPAGLVGLTKLVCDLTGTRYGSLTQTAYASNAPLEPVLVVTGLGLFVGVPCYLLVCQVVIQGSFRRVVGGDAAVVLTTALAGFLLVESAAGGLSPSPDRGRLVGAALFGLAVALALYAAENVDRRWLRNLSYLPAILFVVLTAASGVVGIGSVAGGLFVVVQIAVLGLAAVTYERTDSLLVPALAYLSLLLTGDAVVFLFEAGM